MKHVSENRAKMSRGSLKMAEPRKWHWKVLENKDLQGRGPNRMKRCAD